MWLTTPRFLVGLAVMAGLLGLTAWAEGGGILGHGLARAIYAGFCLLLMAAVVFRSRARWPKWWSR